MTREMPTYSRSTDSLPDFVVENQLNTFVYLKFLICPPCCHDDAKLEKNKAHHKVTSHKETVAGYKIRYSYSFSISSMANS